MKCDPIILYGLHFFPGVAEYRPPGKEMYRVLIQCETAKKMDATFPGRPMYVNHVDEVDLTQAQGYVIESFYNKFDGANWSKFVLTDSAAVDAYRKGFKLSNAYKPLHTGPGGTWQGVDYKGEILDAEYDHLALVQEPRYPQSVILTPEEFKEYNSEKELELTKLANSADSINEENTIMFFKREKISNSADLEKTVVELSNGKQFTIAELVKNAEEAVKEGCYANGDHKVKAGEEEMSVNALVEKYNAMKKNAEEDEKKKKENEALSEEEKKKNAEEAEEKKKNDEKEAEEKKKNAEKEASEKEGKESMKNEFEKLKNAREKTYDAPQGNVMTIKEQVDLGRSRYGSL